MKRYPTRQPQVTYICDACKEPIANARGFLWLDLDAVADHKRDLLVWMRDGRIGKPPLKPRWSAHHSKCARLPEHTHTIRVDSVRTMRMLHQTSDALMDKLGNDLALTDWLDMLRYVAYGRGAAWFSGEPR